MWIYQKPSLALVCLTVLDKIYFPFNFQPRSSFYEILGYTGPLTISVAHRKKKKRQSHVLTAKLTVTQMHLKSALLGLHFDAFEYEIKQAAQLILD